MFTESTVSLLPKIESALKGQPIAKAWLFGSRSRGEDTSNSDIDLLVVYQKEAKITLFTIGGIMAHLSEVCGCAVDLVDDAALCEFARKDVDKDKILIYER